MSKQDRVCVVCFNEMSLKSGFTYVKSRDSVVGFEDFGEFGSTHRIANHALVVMARGICSRWKQPLSYFLVSNSTPAERLKVIVRSASVGYIQQDSYLFVYCVTKEPQINRCLNCLALTRTSRLLSYMT